MPELQLCLLLCLLVVVEGGRVASGAGPGPGGSTNTALADHLEALRRKVPEGFTVVVQPPFVVIGDESPAQVRARSTNAVKWAVDHLKRDFFTRDPAEIIDIWLFRDEQSYTNHTWRLFRDRPTTPFGYYSPKDRALIMNISTGGGTLVHEIVHPFMSANFPACPAWYNEGLASLFEQSSAREGHIRGLINWRLTGLEQAIREKHTIPFKKLMALTEDEFYGRAGNVHYSQYYAQARYLCYYLQEKGLLVRFHREFRDGAGQDPTGFATLQRVLGENDMTGFQRRWEKYVLGLRTAGEGGGVP